VKFSAYNSNPTVQKHTPTLPFKQTNGSDPILFFLALHVEKAHCLFYWCSLSFTSF
jgi:hypothetical protein